MRQTNIELCRIISILFVLIVHSAFAANGFPQEINVSSLWLIALESIGIIGVNVFVLISGYFSIKLKPKTVFTLVYICLYYFILCTGISLTLGDVFQPRNLLFVSNSHYFILDYIGLALLSPVLNTFVENSNKKTLVIVLLTLIGYQTYFGLITQANATEFDYGYSLMSFSIIYLVGRYIRMYDLPYMKKYSGTLYILSTLLICVLALVALYTKHPGVNGIVYAYNNPIVIISSICFFLFFDKKTLSNNKLINHIAKSTLGILLFHAAKPAVPIWDFMKCSFQNLAEDISILKIIIWIFLILVIFAAATIIDQLRIYLQEKIYKTLKI